MPKFEVTIVETGKREAYIQVHAPDVNDAYNEIDSEYELGNFDMEFNNWEITDMQILDVTEIESEEKPPCHCPTCSCES